MNHIENNFHSIVKAIYILSSRSENIFLPMKPTSAYDLLVEVNAVLSKIKVFKTECKAPSGSYVVNLRMSGGYNKANTLKKPYDPSVCQFLFIDSPEGCYLIPSIEITQTRSLSLSMFGQFLIREHSSAVEQQTHNL